MTVLMILWALAVVAAATAMLVISRIRMTQVTVSGTFRVPAQERYQPMLRLLTDAEFAFAGNNSVLRRQMMKERHKLFREYLRCLARDYGQLLKGIRLVMLHSDRDRPDLAKALALSRAKFALSLCRIEISLRMHQFGIGTVDVSGLVRALDSLRYAHANLLTAAPVAA
jgi:hypothetical protein